jgi:hypothetical protein
MSICGGEIANVAAASLELHFCSLHSRGMESIAITLASGADIAITAPDAFAEMAR